MADLVENALVEIALAAVFALRNVVDEMAALVAFAALEIRVAFLDVVETVRMVLACTAETSVVAYHAYGASLPDLDTIETKINEF